MLGKSGEPSRTRTCDPLVRRAVKPLPSSHGSFDLLTFYTGCSRFGVHLVTVIHTCLPVFTSQIYHKSLSEQISACCSPLCYPKQEVIEQSVVHFLMSRRRGLKVRICFDTQSTTEMLSPFQPR